MLHSKLISREIFLEEESNKMIHEMKLFEEPFKKIKLGIKDIEVRLFDQKRREIKLGDEIIFHNLSDKNESISVIVVGLSLFSNF